MALPSNLTIAGYSEEISAIFTMGAVSGVLLAVIVLTWVVTVWVIPKSKGIVYKNGIYALPKR